jgi:hypothetical protein
LPAALTCQPAPPPSCDVTIEISDFLFHAQASPLSPVNRAMRIAFNPNATMAWFARLMDQQQQYHAGHRP